MTELTSEIKKMFNKKIELYDNVLAREKNNYKILFERGQAKFFLAMATAWKTHDDEPFHDDITEDLRTAIKYAPLDRKDEYKKTLLFVAEHCGLFVNFPKMVEDEN
jgi:hypothetical protein